MWLVYGFALAGADASELGQGVWGERLDALFFDGLTAIASELTKTPQLDVETAVAYDAVERRLAELLPALVPARLGSVVESRVALGRFVEDAGPELTTALALVRGRVQMTLRIFCEAPASLAPTRSSTGQPEEVGLGPGSRYLAERRAREQARRAVPELDPLRQTLADLIVGERTERHARGPWTASAHHLLDRARAAEYRALLDSTEGLAKRGLRWSVRGPLPAYAFAPGAFP